jgi:glucose dehydrogenase
VGLAFVSGIVEPGWFRAIPEAQPTPGQFSFGGIVLPQLRRREGAFTAIDVNTGTVRWQRSTSMPLVGGALATAAGLVFYGEGAATGGAFVALDAATGAERFRFATRGGVNAAPVSFLAEGNQLVTVAAGGNVLSSSRPDDLLITFELRSGED